MVESKYSRFVDEAIEIYNKQTTKSIRKVAELLFNKYKPGGKPETFRVALSKYMKRKMAGETMNVSKRKATKKTAPKPFVLSAWDFKTGQMMEIDAYCEHYKLPRTDIKSYKLVSHTGTPYYNILFKEKVVAADEFNESFLTEIIKKYAGPVMYKKPQKLISNVVDRIVYSDVHIGMDPNKSGYSLYGGKWDREELLMRCNEMVDFIVREQKGNTLILDDLGDFLDGWNGETVRKGHSLPQNMDNQEMFDSGLQFKVLLIDLLVQYYEKIIVNNICEDNHAGAFGYIVNQAFKNIVELKYNNVEVVNHRKFINHYFYGRHCFVISHGKDSHALKFGFKPHLEPKQIEKIDQYLKQNKIYRKADFVEFSKGDSHQMLFDYCTSDDFDYMNYPAFSPSSEWVQTNFKKGRSGFVIQHIDPETSSKVIKPYFFGNRYENGTKKTA